MLTFHGGGTWSGHPEFARDEFGNGFTELNWVFTFVGRGEGPVVVGAQVRAPREMVFSRGVHVTCMAWRHLALVTKDVFLSRLAPNMHAWNVIFITPLVFINRLKRGCIHR